MSGPERKAVTMEDWIDDGYFMHQLWQTTHSGKPLGVATISVR